jgi:small subunit ribosomal protein S20
MNLYSLPGSMERNKLHLTARNNCVKQPHLNKNEVQEEILLATHKSAEKRDRQSKAHRERNIAAKSAIKTKVKTVLTAVEDKNKENSVNALKSTVPALAKAAAKGLIHKKNASRRISRLTKKVNALQG